MWWSIILVCFLSITNIVTMQIIVVIICIVAFIACGMYLLQQHLDPSRRISYHCFLRNVLVALGAYMYIHKMISLTVFIVSIVCFEVCVELFHQFGYTLDPYLYKVINFYRWADTLWASKHMRNYNNYTEGKNDCNPHLSVIDSQLPKFEWMAKEGKIGKGSKVLEIGCGNGEFMKYIKSLGAEITGITPSPDQVVLMRKQGFDVRLIDIWEIESHHELQNYYDCVVMNGSTEHFMNVGNGQTIESQDKLLEHVFKLVKFCINPSSRSRRCVITAIHIHREFSLYENFQLYLLERSYGGAYAHTPDSYVNNSQKHGFKLITKENRTMDYYIWSKKIWYHVYQGLLTDWITMLRSLIDAPVFLANDPYYLHKVAHLGMNTWSWQFDVPSNPLFANADTPPTLHLWLTLEA